MAYKLSGKKGKRLQALGSSPWIEAFCLTEQSFQRAKPLGWDRGIKKLLIRIPYKEFFCKKKAPSVKHAALLRGHLHLNRTGSLTVPASKAALR
ncbi:MAG: hypothetical protein K0S07_1226 [Chlamydiales bacterium]|jgi:hypothetical protein|nr:hypothetical protein [Chlamydiales bacterium]